MYYSCLGKVFFFLFLRWWWWGGGGGGGGKSLYLYGIMVDLRDITGIYMTLGMTIHDFGL